MSENFVIILLLLLTIFYLFFNSKKDKFENVAKCNSSFKMTSSITVTCPSECPNLQCDDELPPNCRCTNNPTLPPSKPPSGLPS